MRRPLVIALAALAVLAGTAGCGVGEGEEQGGDGATLRVTRDFGARVLHEAETESVRDADTVMRLLEGAVGEVETAYGGRFVSAIDGLAMAEDPPRDWFYWVNGVESDVGAADYDLSPGDVVQWDYRRWDAAMRVPAIVGAFPEPMLHGLEGKRLPVRVECAEPSGAACATTKEKLGEAGVTATGSVIGTSAGSDVIRVVVAPWAQARDLSSARVIERGPAESGVFARFSADGRELSLLDASGEAVRTAPPGSGLVAAVAFEKTRAIWLVTGVDDAGVEAAARALDQRLLRDAFAVAVLPGGRIERLPVAGEAER